MESLSSQDLPRGFSHRCSLPSLAPVAVHLNRSTNNLFCEFFFNQFIHREELSKIVLEQVILLRASLTPTRSAGGW